jgi:hypothetical protein
MKLVKPFLLFVTSTILAASAHAQAALQATPPSDEPIGPARGSREFSVGASGSSNQDFDNSSGGLNLGLGYYYTDSLAGYFRQSVNYANPATGPDAWTGWTRLALNQHFFDGSVRPFFGVNAGRLYGDAVRDSWTAGLETGAKFYVRPQTFLQAGVEYGWLFEKSRDLDDRFEDGLWNWSVSVGFNF